MFKAKPLAEMTEQEKVDTTEALEAISQEHDEEYEALLQKTRRSFLAPMQVMSDAIAIKREVTRADNDFRREQNKLSLEAMRDMDILEEERDERFFKAQKRREGVSIPPLPQLENGLVML